MTTDAEKVQKATEELNATIRMAHEVIQDIKRERKLWNDAVEKYRSDKDKEIIEYAKKQVSVVVEDIKEFCSNAEVRVGVRFDNLIKHEMNQLKKFMGELKGMIYEEDNPLFKRP